MNTLIYLCRKSSIIGIESSECRTISVAKILNLSVDDESIGVLRSINVHTLCKSPNLQNRAIPLLAFTVNSALRNFDSSSLYSNINMPSEFVAKLFMTVDFDSIRSSRHNKAHLVRTTVEHFLRCITD